MNKLVLSYTSIWMPLLAGLVMLPIPLLGDFHIESALLAATVGCFWAAMRGCKPISHSDEDLKQIVQILSILYLAGLPLLLFSIFTGCFSPHGLGFWILYPLPSVVFGYSVGRLSRIWEIPCRKIIVGLVLLFVAIALPLTQFFNLPQVYFFNHIWGGWPGPIYDETVRVSYSVLFFRLLTLGWSGLFWWLPVFKHAWLAKARVIICSTGLLIGYSFLPQLGIISPREYIQQQLGGVEETPHFILYYAKEHYSESEINLIALEHEFYLQQITETLNLKKLNSAGKIESYLYGHAWQKKELTGAKFTSYVPVWLQQDQLHIAKQQLESLNHELVHIAAKQFGNLLFNASRSIGLIEGLAVALAADVSGQSTVHQLVAAKKPWPSAAEMKSALSLLGFYGGRAAVNYTATGSFVQFLLKNYPVEYFKKAYRTADFSVAYRQSFESLISEWHNKLSNVTIDSVDQQIAARLFNIPSLFEQECPHVQSSFAQHWDQYRYDLAKGDTTGALRQIDKLWTIAPRNEIVENRWIFRNLKAQNFDKVQKQFNHKSPLSNLLLYADAFAMQAKWDSARKIVEQAAIYPDSLDFSLKQALNIRKDRTRWSYYLNLIYRDNFLADSVFQQSNIQIQLQAIEKAIDHERWTLFERYAEQLVDEALNSRYFDNYSNILHYLGYRQRFKLAKKWIEKVSELKLRRRYRQRLEQNKQWLGFLMIINNNNLPGNSEE